MGLHERKTAAEAIRVSNVPAPDERIAVEIAREAKASDRGAVGSFIERVMSVAPPEASQQPEAERRPRGKAEAGDTGTRNFVPRSGMERAFYRDLALMLADVALHVERETKTTGRGGRESLLLHFAAAALAAYIGIVGAQGAVSAGVSAKRPDIDELIPTLRNAVRGRPASG